MQSLLSVIYLSFSIPESFIFFSSLGLLYFIRHGPLRSLQVLYFSHSHTLEKYNIARYKILQSTFFSSDTCLHQYYISVFIIFSLYSSISWLNFILKQFFQYAFMSANAMLYEFSFRFTALLSLQLSNILTRYKIIEP